MLYFIEGESTLSKGLLDRHGLKHLIPKPKHRQFLGAGPGRATGLIVTNESFDSAIRFEGDSQVWQERFDHPGTYVGYWLESPPTPAQLRRSEMIPGRSITMLDGNQWTVPLLRQWIESDDQLTFRVMLKCALQRCTQTGKLVPGAVVGQYRQLWDQSCKIADDLFRQMKDGAYRIDTDELDSFIASLLGMNYRVSLDEIGLLGLMDIDLYREVLHAALDWDRMGIYLGNLQRRLNVAGTQPSVNSLDTGSGVTPQTTDSGSPNTDQP